MVTDSPSSSLRDVDSIKPLLTAAVLARDEEPVLPITLESACHAADQVLLADTGSQDRTRVIGYRYGARVIQVPWEDDFAAARNRVLQEAEPTWILWLDAGERFDPADIQAIQDFVRTQADPTKVYWMKVVLPPAEGGGSATEMFQARLMPRRSGLQFQGRIRETLLPAMETLGMQSDVAPGTILCHPRRHDSQWKARRGARNLQIAHQENAGNRRPSVRLLLAMADGLVDLEQLTQAKALYLQATQEADGGSPEQLEAYYGLLTSSDTTGQSGDALLAHALQALTIFPLDTQLLCLLGQLLCLRGEWNLAARTFEQAFRHGQVCEQVWHLADLRSLAGWGWALALDRQNEPERALATLQEVVAQTQSGWVRRRLVEKYVQQGREEEAMKEFSLLAPSANPQEQATLQNVVRGASLAAQKNYPAALPLLEEAYEAGCRDSLCLQWLVEARLATGSAHSVHPVLKEWQRVDPAHPELRRYADILHQKSPL